MTAIVKAYVVFEEQVLIIPAIVDLALDLRVEFAQSFYLTILLRYQFLVHGSNLDEEIVLREIEIGRKFRSRITLMVPAYIEAHRFIQPFYVIEIKEPGKFLFAAMREFQLVPAPVLPLINLNVFRQLQSSLRGSPFRYDYFEFRPLHAIQPYAPGRSERQIKYATRHEGASVVHLNYYMPSVVLDEQPGAEG